MMRVNLCKGLKRTKRFPKDNEIRFVWGKYLPELFRGKSLVRYIPNEYGPDFKIIFNKRRAANLTYPKNICPFSKFLKRRYYVIGNYILTPNLYPFAKHHRLLITKKHYANPRLKDFEFILKFCEIIPTTAILSIKGSGAGVPAHLHFQVFDEKLPVMSAKTKFLFSNGEVVVSRIIYPSYGIKIIGKNISKWVFRIIKGISYSYNLAIKGNQVIFYPRTIVLPTKSVEWRFGATELSGFIITKNKEVFDSITCEQIKKYLKKATISSRKDINEFEKKVKNAIKIKKLKKTAD
ncbi:MAG: hypothetical protein NTY48_04180 [Candidatus Diapherotrites archaeon]|nr:hypothetical protein [Candidatus Diapherotrites archaeon]